MDDSFLPFNCHSKPISDLSPVKELYREGEIWLVGWNLVTTYKLKCIRKGCKKVSFANYNFWYYLYGSGIKFY